MSSSVLYHETQTCQAISHSVAVCTIIKVPALSAVTNGNSLELKRIVGNEQPLLGLLQIYKDYYPDVIVERLAPSKSGLFSVGVPKTY